MVPSFVERSLAQWASKNITNKLDFFLNWKLILKINFVILFCYNEKKNKFDCKLLSTRWGVNFKITKQKKTCNKCDRSVGSVYWRPWTMSVLGQRRTGAYLCLLMPLQCTNGKKYADHTLFTSFYCHRKILDRRFVPINFQS